MKYGNHKLDFYFYFLLYDPFFNRKLRYSLSLPGFLITETRAKNRSRVVFKKKPSISQIIQIYAAKESNKNSREHEKL